MAYKTKKLVSVRLDAEDLQVIDEWADSLLCHGRSDVINAAIRLAAWMIENGYAGKLIHFVPRLDTVDDFKLEYHR